MGARITTTANPGCLEGLSVGFFPIARDSDFEICVMTDVMLRECGDAEISKIRKFAAAPTCPQLILGLDRIRLDSFTTRGPEGTRGDWRLGPMSSSPTRCSGTAGTTRPRGNCGCGCHSMPLRSVSDWIISHNLSAVQCEGAWGAVTLKSGGHIHTLRSLFSTPVRHRIDAQAGRAVSSYTLQI